MTTAKTLRRFSCIKPYLDAGLPVVKIADLYIVFPDADLAEIKLTEVALIAPKAGTTGTVTLGHLDRLGNANHASPVDRWTIEGTAFPTPADQ